MNVIVIKLLKKMEGVKRTLKKQISSAQKVILIEFVEEHPELVSNKHTNQFTSANAQRLWQEVCVKLNSTPGAEKTWQEWRKVCNVQNK